MKNRRKIIGLVGSHCTGKTYVADLLQLHSPDDVFIVRENMDTIIKSLGYFNVNAVKKEDWWLVEDLMLLHHYSNINEGKLTDKKIIVCDRTIYDIAAYTMYYNEYIPDEFIKRVIWYCQRMAPYTDIIFYPTDHIESKEDGFRKIRGRESIDCLIRGILERFNVDYKKATSCLTERRSELMNIAYNK